MTTNSIKHRNLLVAVSPHLGHKTCENTPHCRCFDPDGQNLQKKRMVNLKTAKRFGLAGA
jgi:hypothetical protein